MDAPVDWVKLEFRDKDDPIIILVEEAAIVLKDGTVVDPQGSETLTFASLSLSEYHIAIVHSNHLGIMTATSIDLSTDPFIDFAESSTAVYYFRRRSEKRYRRDHGMLGRRC